LCATLLAAGPTITFLRVASTAASSTSEEENERVEEASVCTRPCSRRLLASLSFVPPGVIIDMPSCLGLPLVAWESGAFHWARRDGKLGVGAPLRC
jgi:hypothetical protein